MLAEQKMYEAIQAHSPLVDLIGERFEVLRVGQEYEMPCAMYRRTFTAPASHVGGDSGYSTVSMEVLVISDDYSQAKAVARQVRKALKSIAIFGGQSDEQDQERQPTIYLLTLDFTVSEQEDI